jgi:hypothetical protein
MTGFCQCLLLGKKSVTFDHEIVEIGLICSNYIEKKPPAKQSWAGLCNEDDRKIDSPIFFLNLPFSNNTLHKIFHSYFIS